MHKQLSIKKYIYTSLNLYIHPAETHRLLKFLFHIMGRLVPAHNKNKFKIASSSSVIVSNKMFSP